MTSEGFSPGDLVWAKVRYSSSWPARIEASPPPYLKPSKNKNAYCVCFFGTRDYGHVLKKDIFPHSESVLSTLKKKKTPAFQKAIDDLMQFLGKKESSKLKMKTTKVPLQTKGIKYVKSVGKKQARTSAGKSSPKDLKISPDMNSKCSLFSSSKSSNHKQTSNTMDVPETSVSGPSNSPPKKHIKASKKRFGFIGLGQMGISIVKNLVKAGHDVTVWNRSSCKYHELEGVKIAESPADLVLTCDLIFCCVSDSGASMDVMFRHNGVIKGFEAAEKLGELGKGYIELTVMDESSSIAIGEFINDRRGLYMEAPLCGTKKDAEDGTLLILASGDRRVFSQCETCFYAIGRVSYYLNYEIGYSAILLPILNAVPVTVITAIGEVMALADKLKVQKDHLIALINFFLNAKNMAKCMHRIHKDDYSAWSTHDVRKDISLALSLAEEFNIKMPVTAATNELNKRAEYFGYSGNDIGAIYKTLKYTF